MLTNYEGKIFIEVYIMDFMDLKLHFMTHKQKHNKTHTQITKKRNILVIVWMVALIKHSITNKTNSNNN